MNSGQIRSSVVSTFSRTIRRVHSARRLRRGRLVRLRAASDCGAGSASTGTNRIGRPYFMAMRYLRGDTAVLPVPGESCHCVDGGAREGRVGKGALLGLSAWAKSHTRRAHALSDFAHPALNPPPMPLQPSLGPPHL